MGSQLEFGLLGAVVEPSGVLGVGANVLFAKLSGPRAPIYSFIHGVPLAKLHSHTAPTLAAPFLIEGCGPPFDVPGAVEKATGPMNKWISVCHNRVAGGLAGTINDLRGASAWTKAAEGCLLITDMDCEELALEVDLVR